MVYGFVFLDLWICWIYGFLFSLKTPTRRKPFCILDFRLGYLYNPDWFASAWSVVACALFALSRVFVHVGFGMGFVVVKLMVFATYSFVMLSCACFWFGLLFRCVAA